jgi:hypothetical protein
MRTFNTLSRLGPGALALALAAVTAWPAAAQIGAIGAAPAIFSNTDQTVAAAPILGESAYVLGRGQFGATALYGLTSGSLDLFATQIDYSYSQVVLAAFYAPSDRVTLGIAAAPYLAYSFTSGGESADTSGRGDLSLYAKTRLWTSSAGVTSLGAYGSVALPVGETGFGHEGVLAGLGLALSHHIDRVTLHASGGFAYPTKEVDGKTTVNFAGAAVIGASPAVNLDVELLGAHSDGEYVIDVAPGARVRLGTSFFLSAAMLFNASTSLAAKPYDHALVIGGSVIR